MSIHYETCARCDKDLVITMSDDYYFSDIDGKVLCKECYEKEQPKELVKQITDLEAKLAEKDRVCDKLQRDIECLEENYAQLESDYEKANELGLEPSYIKRVIKKNEELKQQLAEKEKEILDIKFMMRNTEQALRNVPNAMAGQRKRIDELTKELKELKQDNQDKISFALEQLEKVKEDIIPIFCVPNGIYSNLHNEVFKKIDNQIKQLKEMK